MKEGKKKKKKEMKHSVSLMSYLKIKTQSVCMDVWQLVDASSNHLYFIRLNKVRYYVIIYCKMHANQSLPVRKAYSFDKIV